MDFYTKIMMEIVGMPRLINIQSKRVSPAILFSSALAESLLFWQSQSMSLRLHGHNVLGIEVISSPEMVSGTEILRIEKNHSDAEADSGLGAGLMMLAAAGDYIIQPARKHANFDYAPLIIGFRDAVEKHYDGGSVLDPSDFYLNSVFYDNITKPNRDVNYKPPELTQGVKR